VSWEGKKKKKLIFFKKNLNLNLKKKSVVGLVVIAPFVHAFVEEDMGLGWVGEVCWLWRKLNNFYSYLSKVF
jgi:hypothetical protein